MKTLFDESLQGIDIKMKKAEGGSIRRSPYRMAEEGVRIFV
jgi:hypothetical protein